MKRAALAILLALSGALPAQAASAPPRRVASVFLCTDEYLFRLLPKERIAALSFLAGDRNPVVSTIVDQVQGMRLIPASAEAVLSAAPDLVVLSEGSSAGVRRVVEAAKIPIVDVPWPNSLADIPRITRNLSIQLGVPEVGEALIRDMEARLAAARAAAPNPPVATLLYEPNGYTVSGGITEELMRLAGLVNIAPGLRPTRQQTIPVETVVATPPELLIFNGTQGIWDSRARQKLDHPALARVAERTATKWLGLAGLLCPGPWSAGVAEAFAQAGREARE